MVSILDSLKELVDDCRIALIPVGEKDKQARVKWGADSMKNPLSLLALTDLMGKHDTNAVALVCGEISGNLFAIDFDVKNKRDLGGGEFLGLFNSVFGDLVSEMRFEQTPSGGNHIYYRVSEVPKDVEFKFSPKAANRESTKDELLINPKEKTKCFIEIKGNGNICQCYPSPGYLLLQGKIGTVRWSDHLRILEFIKSFDEVIKEVKQRVDISRDEKSWYVEGENPFECFNKNHNGGLLEEDGWLLGGSNKKYDHFARPGSKKDYYVGASYDKVNKMYNIFTSSSNLEVRSYNPSDLLCILKYGGDKGDLCAWLVSKGYGVLKKSVELRKVKESAKFGTPLPANISEESRNKLNEEKEKISLKYPHGIFWNIVENSKGEYEIEISQKKIDAVIISLGFRNIVGEGLVLIDGYLVKKVEEGRIFHTLVNYILRIEGFEKVDEVEKVLDKIEENDRLEAEKVYNAYSSFINKYGKITIERLKEFGKIQDGKVLTSSKTESFKFYKNCYVSVTKDGIDQLEYSDLGDRLVFEHLIMDRDFNLISEFKESKPYEFFNKAIGFDASLLTILGYLTHDFIDDSMNAIFVGLGTPGCGKNIFFNLLNHITSVHIIDGRQIELDKNLLQSYNFERLLVISDVEEKFKYDFFKNFSSGAASLKKLYKDVVVLRRKKMPKPVVLSNFPPKMVEGLERRLVIMEFKPFFSLIKGGVATHFDIMFPSYDLEDKGGWNENDWNCFDTICLLGIFKFLKVGKLEPNELTDDSWYRVFNATWGHLFEYFNEKIDDWMNLEKVKCTDFDKWYLDWCGTRKIRYTNSPQKYNKALSEYCEYIKCDFQKSVTLKDEHGFDCKFKMFKKQDGVKNIEEDLPF